MKIYKKSESIIFYMSIEEQNKQTGREHELNLRERKLEEREKILKQKEEILSNMWGDIQNIKDSIHKSLEIFDNNVSDDLLQMKSLLSELYFPNLRYVKK